MALPLIEPVLPVLSRHLPRGREWVYEPKMDGFRGTFYCDADQAFFRSKTKRKMARFQPLADQLAKAMREIAESVILDGEIVGLDETGNVDFYALMAARGVPQYAAFDLMWLDGADLRAEPYTKRKRLLRKLLKALPDI